MLTRREFGFAVAATGLVPAAAFAAGPESGLDVAYGTHAQQRYDVYLPEAGVSRRGAVVFLHGGGWRIGDKRNHDVWKEKARHFTAQGLAFASVNTRLMPDADPLQQAKDLAVALSHVQKNAGSLGIDAGRIVLMGHSAGGHVAALLAARPALAARRGAAPWAGTVVLDIGGLDIEARMAGSPGRIYRQAFGTDPAFWRATSPTAQLTSGTAPFLIVCSSRRRAVCPDAKAFARKVTAKGGRAEVLPVDLSHRQINADLGRNPALTSGVDRFLADMLAF